MEHLCDRCYNMQMDGLGAWVGNMGGLNGWCRYGWIFFINHDRVHGWVVSWYSFTNANVHTITISIVIKGSIF